MWRPGSLNLLGSSETYRLLSHTATRATEHEVRTSMSTPTLTPEVNLENIDLLSGSDAKDQWPLALCSPGPHVAGCGAVTQSLPGGKSEVPECHIGMY